MNKSYFIELADFNTWANNIVREWLTQLTDEQWLQPLGGSFNNIAATALHIAGAETAWLGRLNNEASPVWLPAVFNGGRKELLELWATASEGLKTAVTGFDETKLLEGLNFKRINGEQVTLPYYQIFAHVFNHSTYHRGQLVTLLRQVGFTNISSTDIMTYFRK
jgi:uncharacterized damage-inducible protein DinB